MKPFTSASGAARLAGVDTGGSSDACVFLHAGVADLRSWLPLIERMPDRRAIAYDRRGFGASSWEPERFSHAADLAAVLDDRGLDRVVLIGNSQGGRIAVDYTFDHPERVAALVLIAPAISGAPEPPIESYSQVIQRQAAALERAEEARDLDAVNEIEAQLWLDGPEQEPGRVGGALRDFFST
jgi:pimeloyl-ACP methyl ester carboxylesterase